VHLTNKDWLMAQESKLIAEYIADCKCCGFDGECTEDDEHDFSCQNMIEKWLNTEHEKLQ
jgi:hypothetical protein